MARLMESLLQRHTPSLHLHPKCRHVRRPHLGGAERLQGTGPVRPRILLLEADAEIRPHPAPTRRGTGLHRFLSESLRSTQHLRRVRRLYRNRNGDSSPRPPTEERTALHRPSDTRSRPCGTCQSIALRSQPLGKREQRQLCRSTGRRPRETPALRDLR